eukprot:3524695-Amphidinium_carterae.1
MLARASRKKLCSSVPTTTPTPLEAPRHCTELRYPLSPHSPAPLTGGTRVPTTFIYDSPPILYACMLPIQQLPTTTLLVRPGGLSTAEIFGVTAFKAPPPVHKAFATRLCCHSSHSAQTVLLSIGTSFVS